MTKTPWAWYSWWINEKAEAAYMKFHSDRRFRKYRKENGIELYRMNPLRMLLEERRVQREYQEETQRLAMAVRLGIRSGLLEAEAIAKVVDS